MKKTGTAREESGVSYFPANKKKLVWFKVIFPFCALVQRAYKVV